MESTSSPLDALETLIAACEAEFTSPDTEDAGECRMPDEEEVASPSSHITFGMIRQARAALAAFGKEDTDIRWMLRQMEDANAALMSLVPRDENDVALWAVVAVQGQPETDEILTAVEQVQNGWDG